MMVYFCLSPRHHSSLLPVPLLSLCYNEERLKPELGLGAAGGGSQAGIFSSEGDLSQCLSGAPVRSGGGDYRPGVQQASGGDKEGLEGVLRLLKAIAEPTAFSRR